MKKILIVDDSAFMRNVLKDLLASNAELIGLASDFETYEADGKTNALTLTQKIKPDVIFLDIVMRESEIEGVEFIEEIKEFFDSKKIIVISSIGQTDILNKCKENGIVFYLQKPFEQAEVINSIKKIIG